jgi:ketosteroid isomerase-like protein
MSERNVELAYRGVDAFNRRDLDGFLALHDPDVEFITRAQALEAGPYSGRDGIRRWWTDLLRISPDFRVELEEVRELDDLTITRQRHHGSGAASGVPMTATAWQVTRWRDGKAIWWCMVLTEAEALEAAGRE